MVTREQFLNGVLTYADKEIMPKLSTGGKWGFGTIIMLLSSKSSELFDSVMSNQFVKTLGVITDDGLIDIDALSEALTASAKRYGKLQVEVPVLGIMTFSENDICKVRDCIVGGTVKDGRIN